MKYYFANKNYPLIVHQYALSDSSSVSPLSLGCAVVQLVKSLRYKPEGYVSDWDFSLS